MLLFYFSFFHFFSDAGKVVFEESGQAKLRHGDEEIRFQQPPFALFPGEKLVGNISPLQVVAPNSALRLRAIRDGVFDGEKRLAGDEWLFKGPDTYIPRVEVQVVAAVSAIIIKPNQALRLRARKEIKDVYGDLRKAGEEWLVREAGAYLPDVNEEVVETVSAVVLTDKKALHLQAVQTFTDVFKKQRKAGEEWLVTFADAEVHLTDVHERLIGEVKLTTLNSRQYCVVLDPVIKGVQHLGKRELRKGEISFFLKPGERLESGIQQVNVLDSEEALLLRAREAFKDGEIMRKPGDRWMINGPTDYVPPVEVDIVERRRSMPLDDNEGIYVRDINTGKVTMVTGTACLLKPNEELWSKELPEVVERLLVRDFSRDRAEVSAATQANVARDKTRVVTYRIPHNAAVQIYDFKAKASRIVFGPDLVMLGPDETFTVLSLSGEIPKRGNVIKAIALMLGPDFMTDEVVVETSDHARLCLRVSYNWQFHIPDRTDKAAVAKIFSVPDFIGDACKAIASRVRGAVASHTFDSFHKNSATLIRAAVFGVDADGTPRNNFVFNANNLVISNIDIQSVEPVDQRTRDALQKSVQLAIEITTKSQEAEARHEAERREQAARGLLERQKILDEAQAEKHKKELLTLQAESAEVESTGQVTAEAKAKAEASLIEGEAAVRQAELQAHAFKIKSESEMAQLKARQSADVAHRKALSEMEIEKARKLAEIEGEKFADIVDAIGAETIKSIAQAGPEMQAKLLKGLGLKGFMITDGSSPINLFNTAQGLIGGAAPKKAAAGPDIASASDMGDF